MQKKTSIFFTLQVFFYATEIFPSVKQSFEWSRQVAVYTYETSSPVLALPLPPIHPHSACFLHQQRHHLHLHPEMLIVLFQRESLITSPRLRRPPSWGRWRRWMTTGRSWRSPSWHRPSTTTRTTTASRRARSCARWSSPRSPASSDRLSRHHKHTPPPIIIITITTCVYLTRW